MSFGSVKLTHNDGTMHHLGIDERAVAPQVVLTPDPLEVPQYAALLTNAEKVGEYREYVTYTGIWNGVPLSVMSCGFGCMPMAIAVEELHHLGVRRAAKIARCPALLPELRPGTLLAASGAVRGDGATREYVGLPYPAVPDMALLSRLLRQGVGYGIFRSHDCTGLETPLTEDGRDRLRRWQALGVSALDGETSALYVVSGILGMQTVSLVALSENYATGEAAETFDRAALFCAAAEALTCC